MEPQTAPPSLPPPVGAGKAPTAFGSYCPVPIRPPLARPWHWPFRAWADTLLRHPVELLAVATVIVLLIGASLLFWTEHGASPAQSPSGQITIKTWWDAMWLCVTSATTDSYGDVAPVTVGGRVVSIVIAFLGIILVGSFTAAITSYIIREPSADSAAMDELRRRLERIEVLLLEQRNQSNTP